MFRGVLVVPLVCVVWFSCDCGLLFGGLLCCFVLGVFGLGFVCCLVNWLMVLFCGKPFVLVCGCVFGLLVLCSGWFVWLLGYAVWC